ncbi:putative holin-like toxin [Clostridium cochlearium]
MTVMITFGNFIILLLTYNHIIS